MARAPLLQVTDIALTFGGDPVFSDLSLVVQPGDRVALVGRNGSGKSTLLKVMAGLVEVDSGGVVVAPGMSVGYMEQDPSMEGCATLGDYASSGLDASDAWRVEAVAEGLKFDPARDINVASGGERRRAALAKLMAEAPGLMLLDEPFAALGPALKDEMLDLVAELATELEATLLMVSHDPQDARRIADQVILVAEGVAHPPQETTGLLDNPPPALRAYLG